MKKTRFCAVFIVIAIILSMSSLAAEDRASDQLSRYSVTAGYDAGKINVTVSIIGTLTATRVGCESIRVYEKVGSFWSLQETRDEFDSNMAVNSRNYLYTHSFDAKSGTEYRVDITIFAENPEGRDTRSFIRYI